jgi:hypothetical protein|tara:strand:+ start:669 stop:980 length:312 start_codon:yes stop_codon:yes gene_type:complete
MIIFPKVIKGSARGVSGRQRVRKIFSSLALAAGITGAAVAGNAGTVKAAVSPDADILTGSTYGALLFVPAEQAGDIISYHRSHQSHRSHYSHRSHQSHYSSRW